MEMVNVIQSLGFPIAMVLMCAWFIKKMYDMQNDNTNKMIEREREQWDKLADLTSAVNENSSLLRALVSQLAGEDNGKNKDEDK